MNTSQLLRNLVSGTQGTCISKEAGKQGFSTLTVTYLRSLV